MEEQQMRIAPKSIPSATNSKWWLFCLAIVVLKFLLLALDPLPKLYLDGHLRVDPRRSLLLLRLRHSVVVRLDREPDLASDRSGIS